MCIFTLKGLFRVRNSSNNFGTDDTFVVEGGEAGFKGITFRSRISPERIN